jgi:hypothetical protein
MADALSASGLSMTRLVTSSVQSPPALALPMSLLDAPTVAPVTRASSCTSVRPAASAPMLHP